jgi:hypothetical protein
MENFRLRYGKFPIHAPLYLDFDSFPYINVGYETSNNFVDSQVELLVKHFGFACPISVIHSGLMSIMCLLTDSQGY